MKIVLFRHGAAVDREEAMLKKIEESQRPLIEKGRERTRAMGKTLKELEPSFDMIICSPLLRAQQTAELLAPLFRKTELHQSLELVPQAAPQAFAIWLKTYAKNKRAVLIIGHEPQLSTFASWVLGGQTESFINLKKSGMLAIEVESLEAVGPRSGQLCWLISAKQTSAMSL